MTKCTMFEGCHGERGTILPLGEKTEHSGRMRYVCFCFLKLQKIRIPADTGLDIRNYATANAGYHSDTLL